MSEMIQRVARSLWKQERDTRQHDEPFKLSWYEDAARTAIDAMRPPTSQMVSVGADELLTAMTPEGKAFRSWVAMIDEALKD